VGFNKELDTERKTDMVAMLVWMKDADEGFRLKCSSLNIPPPDRHLTHKTDPSDPRDIRCRTSSSNGSGYLLGKMPNIELFACRLDEEVSSSNEEMELQLIPSNYFHCKKAQTKQHKKNNRGKILIPPSI
jgi:hypothetical protein